jgi:DNA-directed RNA polymerase subunit RPC12/RpoP
MQSKSLVRTRQIYWTPPVLEVEYTTCGKCGRAWQYTGSSIIATCPSCRASVIAQPSVYETVKALRNKDRVSYTCPHCKYEGMRGKDLLQISCYGCGKTILYRERLRRGGISAYRPKIIQFLQKHPKATTSEIRAETNTPYHSTLSAVNSMFRNGELVRVLAANPTYGKRCGGRKTIYRYSLKNANK